MSLCWSPVLGVRVACVTRLVYLCIPFPKSSCNSVEYNGFFLRLNLVLLQLGLVQVRVQGLSARTAHRPRQAHSLNDRGTSIAALEVREGMLTC